VVRWEQRYFGHEGFPRDLSPPEVARFFTPTPEELPVVLQRRSPTNRIAFALQIGFLKMTGRSLNSVELVPQDVLAHLGQVVGCPPPRIASIRALYSRRRTLFDHQAAARQLLGRREVPEHGLRGLTAYLRREAIGTYSGTELASKARIWLIGGNYVLPREREIRRQTIRALRHHERVLFDAVCAATEARLRQGWADRLLEPAPDGGTTRLEWLQAPPTNRPATERTDHLARIGFLA
jgi:Domain of unknown function (DUF4158)